MIIGPASTPPLIRKAAEALGTGAIATFHSGMKERKGNQRMPVQDFAAFIIELETKAFKAYEAMVEQNEILHDDDTYDHLILRTIREFKNRLWRQLRNAESPKIPLVAWLPFPRDQIREWWEVDRPQGTGQTMQDTHQPWDEHYELREEAVTALRHLSERRNKNTAAYEEAKVIAHALAERVRVDIGEKLEPYTQLIRLALAGHALVPSWER